MNIELYKANYRTRGMINYLIESTLQHSVKKIRNVHVTFKDQNGPKGGVDTQAGMRVKLKNGMEFFAKGVADNQASASAIALSKIQRQIIKMKTFSSNRRLGRQSRGLRYFDEQDQQLSA